MILQSTGGGPWTIVPSAPAVDVGFFDAVSCSAVDTCSALGGGGPNGFGPLLVESVSGGAWSSPPAPGGLVGPLYGGMSCFAAGCVGLAPGQSSPALVVSDL
jgi:hypothetical protein